jgi:hypothetical protein
VQFARREDVTPDPERPGVLRAPDIDVAQPFERRSEAHMITAWDCARLEGFTPDLVEHGFAYADLSQDAELQARLERVRVAGRIEEVDVAEIRRRLAGRSLALSGGRRAKILFVAPEGFLMRRCGPNRMPMNAGEALGDRNGLDGAAGVHADQDVGGTPLRQIMRGAAPWLFRHEAPDSRNRRSPLFLLNVWIPLDQITRPLCLMDRRTVDRPRHQARFGLKVDRLLRREDADRAFNHVWQFLHDDAQRWYFTSELGADRAYVFDTLGTPHASFVLPGEDLAEARYRRLDEVRAAIEARDPAAVARAATREASLPGDDVTAPLRRAIAEMDALLEEAREGAAALGRGEGAADWCERAGRAQARVVRKSIELRAVAVVTGGFRPRRSAELPRTEHRVSD